jgi:ADP-heptose:LPS heptosyltransferase
VRIKPGGPVRDVSGHVQYKQKTLANAVNILENDVRISFAVMAGSKAIVTSEGGVHHFAAAINKPAFVLYGGVIHPDQTGYFDRNQTYYVYDHPETPCGSQIPCNHCRQAMDAIKPQMIFEDVMQQLESTQ